MQVTEAPTFWVRIYMAGDIADARRVCRDFAFNVGACVTVTPTDYVYSGGQEAGFIVGFINYPRFPKSPAEIEAHADTLARMLGDALCQRSWTIESPQHTRWFTRTLPFELEAA